MTVHTVTVQGGPSFPCPDDRPILVVAWEQGVMLPFSCRVGRCGRCAARVVSGRVDPATPEQVRLCSTYALSDCTIEIG
ncbi:MAG: 2Fe-2S iron-sulfur cluster-binding protein [Cyanobacteriota bacterium]|nr:2Fe-2S iron-sulfur cluster-binding protein [Cyanobacteriota bacterium]